MRFLRRTDVLNHIIPESYDLTLSRVKIKHYFTHVGKFVYQVLSFKSGGVVGCWLLLRRFYDSFVSLLWARLLERKMIASTNWLIEGRICTGSSPATIPAQWPPAMVNDWRSPDKASQHFTDHGQRCKEFHEWNVKNAPLIFKR